uniref:Uncharacterized protein n=1 Tax=Ulva partita TaxID=1605170 RepID=A0A1C9ZWB8_9CHLO|nr:hypothetical protein [Ulva partita]
MISYGLVFRNTATCRDLLQTGTTAEIALEWQNLPTTHTKQPTNTRKHSAHGQDRYFGRNGPCTTRTGSTTLLPCSIAASPNTSIRQVDHRKFKWKVFLVATLERCQKLLLRLQVECTN